MKAIAYAQAGAEIVIITGRRANKLDDVRAVIGKESPSCRVLALSCDVKDEKSVDDLFATLKAQGVHLDVLINNAGSSAGKGSIADSDPSLWWGDYVSPTTKGSTSFAAFRRQFGPLQRVRVQVSHWDIPEQDLEAV